MPSRSTTPSTDVTKFPNTTRSVRPNGPEIRSISSGRSNRGRSSSSNNRSKASSEATRSVGSSSAAAGDREELLPDPHVLLVVAAPERCPRSRLLLADAPHLRAEVHRLEVDRHAVRLEQPLEEVGDLGPDPLLHREPPGEQPDEAGGRFYSP